MSVRRKKTTQGLLFAALADPVRQSILKDMAGEDELSPSECSKRLRVPLSSLSHHFRVLATAEAIVLVRTEPVRGTKKHFYRFAIEEPWALEALGLAPPSSR